MNRLLTLAAAGVGGWLVWQALRPRYDFRGKNVLITGGSRGLGLVLARKLADVGARLSLCARDPDELADAATELRSRGARVTTEVCDITDRQQVRNWIARSRERLGPVDVLINNAGIIGVGPVEEMRLEDFERSLKTHVWGVLYTCLEVLPEMKARRQGRIVNISSFGGKVAVPHMLPYTTGKFALVGLSNGLRAELDKDGIVVTTVCPGLMQTGSHLQAEFKGRHEEEYAWFSLGGAMPGLSMPADQAAAEILAGCARGDAEVTIGLPAKLATLAQNLFPNLMASLEAFVNEHILPEAGGVGPRSVKGRESRGKTPELLTANIDRAADSNNEHHTGG